MRQGWGLQLQFASLQNVPQSPKCNRTLTFSLFEQSGYFSGTAYITHCWLSHWHDHSCEIEQRWGAQHGMLCFQEWRHLLTWGDKESFDAGTRGSMRLRLKITIMANAMFYHCCIQTVDKKWPVPPLSSGWCAAWSLLNRSTPAICMYAFIEPVNRKKVAWLPCSFAIGLWVCTSLHRRVHRYVLSEAPANTDDVMVAQLTNMECCSVRQKSPWRLIF